VALLLIEIPLALLALRRGWRAAPALLLALPLLVLAFESGLAAWLLPLVDGYFDPAGTARAVAHGIALPGLALVSFMDPFEQLATIRSSTARRPGAAKKRRAGSLYQI
jgi:hypothetical protein